MPLPVTGKAQQDSRSGWLVPSDDNGRHLAVLGDIARDAATQVNPAAPHAQAINFCVFNPTFMMEHLRMSRAQSASSILGPSKALVRSILTSLFRQAVTMRGDALHSAAWSLVFIFPTLVSGPHRPGAPSSAVKTETQAMVDP
jgi:hypothetical protein